MKKNAKKSSTRTNRQSKLRMDTRSLLRSRPLQAMMVGVAALQGVAVAAGKSGHQERQNPLTGQSSVNESLVMQLAPVAVVQPVKAAVEVKKPEEKAEPTVASADALAEEYRAKGFKVSDALAEEILEAALENDIEPEVVFGL